MVLPEDLTSLGRDGLLALIAGLQKHVASLREQVVSLHDHVERLTAVNEELSQEIADLKRAGKRQAAPFSKGTRATNPKRPGRKPGKGSFSYRKPPSADEVTGPPVDVTVTTDTCPVCGGKLQHERVDVAYVTDIPPTPQPVVTEFRVQVCRCMSCGKQVRGRSALGGLRQISTGPAPIG